MSEIEVDDAKNNAQNSLLKSRSKESVSDEQSSKSKRVVFQEKPIILNQVAQKIPDSTNKSELTESEKKDKKERNRPPTKVVVRRLPPSMTLESFIDNVSPLPEHDYIYFVRADTSLGPNAFSRAYINFVNMDDLLTFYEQFDNYVFMDTKGNEYPAVVEFAPFQRVPKKRLGRKKDPKVGTLKDDPAFISFVASLKEKKDTSSVKQASAEHLLALTNESSAKKDFSTPLLEFIKQRRAERQRVREEKREERKRKELERKKIKEEERKRRKESDSVLKVLRNPEHEDKEESGKNGKERDRSQQIVKKREEERKHREKERKEKREIKGRDGPSKNFRDEHQKQVDSRMPRKVVDDQRRKLGGERNQLQNKSDVRHNLEFEKTVHIKETDPRKMTGFSKDRDLKKVSNDKFQNQSKDGERYSREGDIRKNYKDNEMKRFDKSQVFTKDSEYKRGHNEVKKVGNNFGESEARRKVNDNKSNIKGSDSHEMKSEIGKSLAVEDGGKKWELLGAKPKRLASEDGTPTSSESIEKNKDTTLSGLKENMSEESFFKLCSMYKPIRVPIEAVKCGRAVLLRRRSSFESDGQHTRSFDRMLAKPRRQVSLDSEMFFKNVSIDNSTKNIPVSRSQEFEKRIDIVHLARRNSLDSGDFNQKSVSLEGLRSSSQGTLKLKSDFFVQESEKKRIITKSSADTETTDFNCNADERAESRKGNHQNIREDKSDRNRGDASRKEEIKAADGSGEESSKRDPRAERRIRNKDRPSIEIYRPGMGRFSMQRKEREKTVGVGSSTEQESPSNSPSPTPSTRLPSGPKATKGSQELRSMTFKRSISREK